MVLKHIIQNLVMKKLNLLKSIVKKIIYICQQEQIAMEIKNQIEK